MTCRVVGIVPARLDSTRLPGKALMRVDGLPLIGYVFGRAKRIPGLNALVLATTKRPVDDALVMYASEHGVAVYRGESDDVAGRVMGCARQFGAEYFVRLNGDSPFLDPDLLGQGIALARDRQAEFVTNLIGRTFPYGIAVEVVQTAAFERTYAAMTTADQREHVTPDLYTRRDEFTVATIMSPRPELSRLRLVVDTPTDFEWFERVVAHLGDAALVAGYRQVAAACLALERRSPAVA